MATESVRNQEPILARCWTRKHSGRGWCPHVTADSSQRAGQGLPEQWKLGGGGADLVKTGHRDELGPGDAGMPSLLNADPRPSPKSPRLPALPVSCVAQGLNAPQGPLNAAYLPQADSGHSVPGLSVAQCPVPPTAPAVWRKGGRALTSLSAHKGIRRVWRSQSEREKESPRPVCSRRDCRGSQTGPPGRALLFEGSVQAWRSCTIWSKAVERRTNRRPEAGSRDLTSLESGRASRRSGR